MARKRTTKTTEATPTADAPGPKKPAEQPKKGGSYTREPGGALKRVAHTETAPIGARTDKQER